MGDEFHAHLFGALGQVVEHALAVTFLVVSLALIGIRLALGQHGVDQARQFVRGRSHGLGLVHARAHAVLYKNVPRAVVSNFPCAAFYVAERYRTAVLVVLHTSRDPRVWPRRR